MSTHRANAGRDQVDVHNRLDSVVLAIGLDGGQEAKTTLTAGDAREIAKALQQAADTAERTPGS